MSYIRVNVSKPYNVLVEKNAICNAPEYIKPICKTNRVAIVTDDIVNELYGTIVEQSLNVSGYETFRFAFQHGEHSKNIFTLSDILEFLAINHIRRNDLIIALGGGVVGDITGLAAALYMRGVKVVQIPTTLLSMVDSSVGGKTAIDLVNGKNMAGSFWQPSLVICDPCILESLPTTIFSEGMAEVIKCNVIKELPIIEYILNSTLKEHMQEIIEYCIILKREIVEQDEFDEKGIRNLLNVGHTAAHAIEKLSNYSISHGIAVGTGLIIEARIAERLGICNSDTLQLITRAVETYNLVCNIPWPKESIIDAMMSDKKNRDAKVVFELPISLGRCKEYQFSKKELFNLLTI